MFNSLIRPKYKQLLDILLTNLCQGNNRVSICDFKTRFYSVNGLLISNNSNAVCRFSSINCSHAFSLCVNSVSPNFNGKTYLLPRRFLLPASAVVSQKRSFSFKESFDSATLTHSAFFKSISESSVVEFTQNFIIKFHDLSGLPWWISIIMTTLLVRSIIVFPLALYQNYVLAKLENARLEMNDIVNNIKYDLNREVRRNKWPEKKAKQYFNMMVRKEWRLIIERDNCHPAKVAILALFQIPTWIVLSSTFRNLVYKLPHNDAYAELKSLELSVGGVAWFPDLTVADSFILPITLGLVNLAIIEIQAMVHKGQRTKIQKYATNFFRGFAIFMVPVAASVPSCLTLYWVSSSSFGLIQNLAILSPRLRRLVGIPPSPSSHTNPYTHLAEQIRDKFRK